MVDIITLQMDNFGGDPFETFSLGIRKYARYDFSYTHRKSIYSYHDIILPSELGELALAQAGDFHTFQFERRQDNADLKIWLNNHAHLNLGYHRFIRSGESATTFDIGRDEFEFEQPLDETKNEYTLAVDYTTHGLTLVLEENIRDYQNSYSFFLPGFSTGEDSANIRYPTQLDFFYFNQPYDFKSYTHTFRILGNPTQRLNIRGSASLQNLDLNMDYNERYQGINFSGTPLAADLSGSGSIKRDLQLYDLDLSYLLRDRVSLVGRVQYHKLSQDGSLAFDNTLNQARWDFNIFGLESGLQFVTSSHLTLTGGIRYERRETDSTISEEEGTFNTKAYPTTKQIGLFGNISWSPNKEFNVTADYQFGDTTDPFTLASPTTSHRFRTRARWNLKSGFNLQASYWFKFFNNNNVDWTLRQNLIQAGLGYTRSTVTIKLDYGFISVKQDVVQTISTSGFGAGPPFN